MKSWVPIVFSLVILAASCAALGAESDAVFTPISGLECPTDYFWGEYGTFAHDAEGLATAAAAIEAGFARWDDQVDGEVTVIDGIDETDRVIGALVVGGHRVVLVFPELAPAGGWLIFQTVSCEGYER